MIGALRHPPHPRSVTLGEDRALVRLHAVAPAATAATPEAFGAAPLDAAGVVRSVGGAVAEPRVGDRVFGRFVAPSRDSRLPTEYSSIPQWWALAPIPPGISFADAASCISPGLAALAAVDAVKPRPGDRVVVVPGAHPVSVLVIQLARARGASVTTSGTSGAAFALRSLGASEVIDSDRGDVNAAVRRRHPLGVDAVVDAAGDSAAVTARAQILKPGGRLAAVNGWPRAADLPTRRVSAVRVMPRATTPRLLDLAGAMLDLRLTLFAADPASLTAPIASPPGWARRSATHPTQLHLGRQRSRRA